MLKSLISLKPIPPWHFGSVSSDHRLRPFLALLGICSKASLVFRPTAVGNPKYLSDSAYVKIPVDVFIFCFIWSSQLALKKIPEPNRYVCRISDSLCTPFSVAWVNSRQSSANKRYETHGAWIPTLTPLARNCGPVNLNRLDKPSAQRRNKQGEIGSPYLIPRVSVKISEKWPFTLTENFTLSTHFMISDTQSSLKPSLSMIHRRYCHSTRSYALAISILTAHAPVFPFFAFQIVNWFISNQDIIRYKPPRHKDWLFFWYNVVQHSSESIRNHLGANLI